jgi:hypothetical protein
MRWAEKSACFNLSRGRANGRANQQRGCAALGSRLFRWRGRDRGRLQRNAQAWVPLRARVNNYQPVNSGMRQGRFRARDESSSGGAYAGKSGALTAGRVTPLDDVCNWLLRVAGMNAPPLKEQNTYFQLPTAYHMGTWLASALAVYEVLAIMQAARLAVNEDLPIMCSPRGWRLKAAPKGVPPPSPSSGTPHPRDASFRPNPRRRVSPPCPSVLGCPCFEGF